jgi:hypothetical protein
LRTLTVTVARAGTGDGVVTSVPGGISCGADCAEVYPNGTRIVLKATPSVGSTFVGWSGACTHKRRQCAVRLGGDAAATATFQQ